MTRSFTLTRFVHLPHFSGVQRASAVSKKVRVETTLLAPELCLGLGQLNCHGLRSSIGMNFNSSLAYSSRHLSQKAGVQRSVVETYFTAETPNDSAMPYIGS